VSNSDQLWNSGGEDRHSERTWAVLHDPENYNVLLLQKAAVEPK